MRAKISEIFFSIQGEGIYQGRPQIFVRFFGCNLHCRFCDTPLFSFREYSVEGLLAEINKTFSFCRQVCFTGGEPLLYARFIREAGRLLKRQSRQVFLETNGVLPDKFEIVRDVVDIVSMDFKLPSSTGLGNFWREHKIFLEKARDKDVYVKAVIACETELQDLVKTAEIIKSVDGNIPLVLQPEFSCGDKVSRKIDYFRDIALKYLSRVEIIPQMHKYLGIR